jgi:hypothetical protein
MSDDCKRGTRVAKFCTVPSTSPCGDVSGCANYRTVCQPGWAAMQYTTLRRDNNATTYSKVDRGYEAHHLLPVACVTDEILGNTTIEGAVQETEYCINNADNMLAMPMWGMTVKHYCSITAQAWSFVGGSSAPPFENIPQHDFNHNRYNIQVEEVLRKIVGQVTKATKVHKLQGQALQGKLKTESDNMEIDLGKKGIRQGGTDAGWKLGQQGDSAWNEPFSMAPKGEVDDLPFPVRNFNEKLAAWIKRLQRGITGAP